MSAADGSDGEHVVVAWWAEVDVAEVRRAQRAQGINLLSPHELWWEHAAFGSLAIHDLLVHLSSLLHDKIQHVLGIIHLCIGFGQEFINSVAEQLDISARVLQNVLQ